MVRRVWCAVIILLLVNIIVVPCEVCTGKILADSATQCNNEIQDASLSEGVKLLARFHTRYNERNIARSHNIQLAASRINGYIISGAKACSFNAMTGRRGKDNGYMTASIIYDGKYVDGVGGGVCQVSTTLYNALLLAGMQITEVYPHTLKPDYVQPSMDAMVSYGDFDMCFVNPYLTPITVYTSAKSGDLTVDIYGQPNGFEGKFVSETIAEIQPPPIKVIHDEEGIYQDKVIFSGESFTLVRQKSGVRSRLYCEQDIDGKKAKTLLREDMYKPLQGITVFGTL